MKTYTQLLNEIGFPKMNRAFSQRALKTINPKNIKKFPQNVQKLGRTTELIGNRVTSQGQGAQVRKYYKKEPFGNLRGQDKAVAKPSIPKVAGKIMTGIGQGTQAVAKSMP